MFSFLFVSRTVREALQEPRPPCWRDTPVCCFVSELCALVCPRRTLRSCDHAGCVTARGSAYISIPSPGVGGPSVCLSESNFRWDVVCVSADQTVIKARCLIWWSAFFRRKGLALHSSEPSLNTFAFFCDLLRVYVMLTFWLLCFVRFHLLSVCSFATMFMPSWMYEVCFAFSLVFHSVGFPIK